MFRRFSSDNNRPYIKKASELIDTRSHKQKKYISLMVVPSYSSGKTRSLRVPHVLFHGVLITLLVITAVVLGFYLRASYFRNMAQGFETALVETEENFSEFRTHAEQVQDSLIERVVQTYAELNEAEDKAQEALDAKVNTHRTELEIILDQIEEIERAIREMDEERQAIVAGLSARADIIPPIARVTSQLIASENSLRAESLLHAAQDDIVGVELLGMGVAPIVYVPPTHASVQDHLNVLLEEMQVQRMLMDNVEAHRALISEYLSNYPTLWPVSGSVSSGFGWRPSPFGGRSLEFHTGIDIPAPAGTSIRAAGGGVVTFVGWINGYGNTVVIDHGSGIETLYSHNTRNLVREGDVVSRGDIIATVGRTGRATGNHLHFEVLINGREVNPRPFMNEFYS